MSIREIMAYLPRIRRGKERHSLVLGAVAGDQADIDRAFAPELHQLGKDSLAVERRERAVVDDGAVVFGKPHHPQVLDPMSFDVRERKDHDLGLRADRRMRQVELVVDPRERDQRVRGRFQKPR